MTSSQPAASSPPGMSRGLTLLFALAGGAAVGNLYWSQPLISKIGGTLGVSAGSASLLVTVTQIGYALGVFFVVPLGDTLDRRRLIPAIMAASGVALAGAALAPSFVTLLICLTGVGFTTVAGQLLTPLAGDLARDDQRGAVVGTVVSGLLTGILASRTISGVLADALGWRAIYVAASIVTFALALILARSLPSAPRRAPVPYPQLLGSVFVAVRQSRTVQVTLILGATAFSVFTLFWTGLTFLLSAAPFSYSVTRIGLVGLVGLAGALAAQRAGKLHDKGWSAPATGAALVLALASLGLAGFGARSIIVILVSVVLIDIAIQGVNVLNQTRLFAVNPEARSRLNTAFVACNFIGGAIGSALAGLFWQHGGWLAIVVGGAVLIGFGLAVWLTQRRALAVR